MADLFQGMTPELIDMAIKNGSLSDPALIAKLRERVASGGGSGAAPSAEAISLDPDQYKPRPPPAGTPVAASDLQPDLPGPGGRGLPPLNTPARGMGGPLPVASSPAPAAMGLNISGFVPGGVPKEAPPNPLLQRDFAGQPVNIASGTMRPGNTPEDVDLSTGAPGGPIPAATVPADQAVFVTPPGTPSAVPSAAPAQGAPKLETAQPPTAPSTQFVPAQAAGVQDPLAGRAEPDTTDQDLDAAYREQAAVIEAGGKRISSMEKGFADDQRMIQTRLMNKEAASKAALDKDFESSAAEEAKNNEARRKLMDDSQRSLDALETARLNIQNRKEMREQEWKTRDDEFAAKIAEWKPTDYWDDKTTGDKILAGISLFLGGLGSGLTGGPNQAMQIINGAIERDLERQKMRFGKLKDQKSEHQNLWTRAYNDYRDEWDHASEQYGRINDDLNSNLKKIDTFKTWTPDRLNMAFQRAEAERAADDSVRMYSLNVGKQFLESLKAGVARDQLLAVLTTQQAELKSANAQRRRESGERMAALFGNQFYQAANLANEQQRTGIMAVNAATASEKAAGDLDVKRALLELKEGQQAGGAGGLTRTTTSRAQQDVINADKGIARLEEIQALYDPSFLTVWGRARAAVARGADRLGVPVDTENLKKYTAFTAAAINNLNLYIKDITGAQMSGYEVDRLRKGMPDPETDAPNVFRTKLELSILILKEMKARQRRVLSQGLSQPGVALTPDVVAANPLPWDELGFEPEDQGVE